MAEYDQNILMDLYYNEYKIDKEPNPHEKNKLYIALTDEWNLMTGEKYDSEDVRTQINNIKRADYCKIGRWKIENRRKHLPLFPRLVFRGLNSSYK